MNSGAFCASAFLMQVTVQSAVYNLCPKLLNRLSKMTLLAQNLTFRKFR